MSEQTRRAACRVSKFNAVSYTHLDVYKRQRYAWPVYDWMGVAKAAFEATNRYCARDLGPKGIRCNLVAAGPIRTTAAKSIPGFEVFEQPWGERAPPGWDVRDPVPTAKACVALLSDWFPAVSYTHLDVYKRQTTSRVQ